MSNVVATRGYELRKGGRSEDYKHILQKIMQLKFAYLAAPPGVLAPPSVLSAAPRVLAPRVSLSAAPRVLTPRLTPPLPAGAAPGILPPTLVPPTLVRLAFPPRGPSRSGAFAAPFHHPSTSLPAFVVLELLSLVPELVRSLGAFVTLQNGLVEPGKEQGFILNPRV